MGYTSVTWTRSHLVSVSSNHGGHLVSSSHSIVTRVVSSVSRSLRPLSKICNDVSRLGMHLVPVTWSPCLLGISIANSYVLFRVSRRPIWTVSK